MDSGRCCEPAAALRRTGKEKPALPELKRIFPVWFKAPEEREGQLMMETIGNVITAIDDAVWGWWLIILLLGTHVFMTFKTGFIQWKSITKGIKLSVTRDPDAEGEVSNFGALTTALAATIGTGNIAVSYTHLTLPTT